MSEATLCIVSTLPQQLHLTRPSQKQVFNISLSAEGCVALITEHTQGQQLKFKRNQEKKKCLDIYFPSVYEWGEKA